MPRNEPKYQNLTGFKSIFASQTFNIRAFIATTMVLTLINTAPIAGLSMIPEL